MEEKLRKQTSLIDAGYKAPEVRWSGEGEEVGEAERCGSDMLT